MSRTVTNECVLITAFVAFTRSETYECIIVPIIIISGNPPYECILGPSSVLKIASIITDKRITTTRRI